MLTVRRCTIAEIMAAPNLAGVLAEYSAECSLAELGEATPQFDIYKALESSGFFQPIAAFNDDNLVGFVGPIVGKLPHYGVIAATIESIFVLREFRKDGVGDKLMYAAREYAIERGAKAVIYSAPVGSQLSMMLQLSKRHRHSNNVFVEGL